MTNFLNTLAADVLATFVTEKAAKAARVDVLADRFPWNGTKSEQNKARDEVRKAYVVSRVMDFKKVDADVATVFVAANYKGITVEGHVLFKAFVAARKSLSRDLKDAADKVNAARKSADADAKLVDVEKITGGDKQKRAPRPASNPADAPAPEAAPTQTKAPAPEAVLVKADALPEAMRAHVAEAVKAAKAFKTVNHQAIKASPAVAEAWAELIAGLEKHARILALALDAAK